MGRTGTLSAPIRRLKLRRPVKAGMPLSWNDVITDEADDAVTFRREMEPTSHSARAAAQ
jgi:hypothetical protein